LDCHNLAFSQGGEHLDAKHWILVREVHGQMLLSALSVHLADIFLSLRVQLFFPHHMHMALLVGRSHGGSNLPEADVGSDQNQALVALQETLPDVFPLDCPLHGGIPTITITITTTAIGIAIAFAGMIELFVALGEAPGKIQECAVSPLLPLPPTARPEHNLQVGAQSSAAADEYHEEKGGEKDHELSEGPFGQDSHAKGVEAKPKHSGDMELPEEAFDEF
jgi:hypothetical protein